MHSTWVWLNEAISSKYVWWPGVDKQFEETIKLCPACQKSAKSPNPLRLLYGPGQGDPGNHKLSPALRCLRRHLEALSRTITSTVRTFHIKLRVSSWTPTIWATEGLTPVIGERRVTTQPFQRLKRLCLVPFSVINDVIMTSLLLVKVTYTLATTWFYQTPYYPLRIFRLMCIWEKIGFWQ